jgi:hypothetical protein
VTIDRFDAMNEQEQRDLARRLTDAAEVLDFEGALRIVEFDPRQAEELIAMRKRDERRDEEFARVRRRRQQALREEFG